MCSPLSSSRYPQFDEAELAFLMDCLHPDPVIRPSADDLLMSPYFEDLYKLFDDLDVPEEQVRQQ